MFNNFFRKSCRLWDNVGKYCTAGQTTDDNTIRRTRIACWVTEVTDTQSEYVVLTAVPRLQNLLEHASIWRYMYIAYLAENELPPSSLTVTENWNGYREGLHLSVVNTLYTWDGYNSNNNNNNKHEIKELQKQPYWALHTHILREVLM